MFCVLFQVYKESAKQQLMCITWVMMGNKENQEEIHNTHINYRKYIIIQYTFVYLALMGEYTVDCGWIQDSFENTFF